jgi:large-conductance mechanosensitive channel
MSESFLEFLRLYISIATIAGIFTFKLLNSLVDNILNPLLSIILDESDYYKLNFKIDSNYQVIKISNIVHKHKYYEFGIGILLRDFIIWLTSMLTLYFISK